MPRPEQTPQQPAPQGAQRAELHETGKPKPALGASPVQPTPSQQEAAQPVAAIAVQPERRLALENDQQRVMISSIGGSVDEVVLKTFQESLGGKTSHRVRYSDAKNSLRPLDWTITTTLVGTQTSSESKLSHIPYSIVSHERERLVLGYTGVGFSIKKELQLQKNYRVQERLFLSTDADTPITVKASNLVAFQSSEQANASGGFGAMFGNVPDVPNVVWRVNDSVERDTLTAVENDRDFSGRIAWFGVDSKYFLNVVIPDAPVASRLALAKTENYQTVGRLNYADRILKKDTPLVYSSVFYAGPKEIDLLKGMQKDLDHTIDLGDWLGPLARPILYALKWIYSFTFNYGLAIIILTVLVKFLLLPLNIKQFKSMKAMQNLQPELARLREKYKDKREQLNMEMMQLFKRNKVNPMGGCLPLILQMPIFFALYRVLFNSIELRHEPFFLWINDLSAPDRFYISPVLMGIVMFWQQKLTPTTTLDPAQARMMMFMPVIFSLFMIALPSGLVIYILTNSLVSIGQQWWIKDRVKV